VVVSSSPDCAAMWGAKSAGRWAAFASSKTQQRLAIAAPSLGFVLGVAGTRHMIVGMPSDISPRCETVPRARKQIGMEAGYQINRDQEDEMKQTLEEMNKKARESLLDEACYPAKQGTSKTTSLKMQSEIGAFAAVETEAAREQPSMSTSMAAWPPPEDFRSDPDFMMKAVRRDGEALKYATPELQMNRALVLEAVRQNGHALEFAAPELRCDRAVVLEAVKQNGLALQFAAEELRADRECVLEAIRETGWAMQYASPELQEDAQLAADGGMGWKTGGY